MSDRHFDVLRAPLANYAPDELSYTRLFDRFEYLLALTQADLEEQAHQRQHFWGPIGAFARRYRHEPRRGIAGLIEQELATQGTAWPLLQAGLFGESLERLRAVKAGFDALLARGTAGWL